MSGRTACLLLAFILSLSVFSFFKGLILFQNLGENEYLYKTGSARSQRIHIRPPSRRTLHIPDE